MDGQGQGYTSGSKTPCTPQFSQMWGLGSRSVLPGPVPKVLCGLWRVHLQGDTVPDFLGLS